jgi:hypothetical protein
MTNSRQDHFFDAAVEAKVEAKTSGQYLHRYRASLAQWRVFHAVIACGSFSGAAEFLHISQPAISYSIAKLEDQFGISLLKLDGRKAYITEAGKALLDRSYFLLREATTLEAFADALRVNGSKSSEMENTRDELPPR